MNENLHELDKPTSNISVLGLSPEPSTFGNLKEKPSSFHLTSPMSSNSLAELGARIICNQDTPHFLQKQSQEPFIPKSQPKFSQQSLSHSSDNLLTTQPKISTNKLNNTNLNNITIYNLEVFNVNSDHLINSNFNSENGINNSKLSQSNQNFTHQTNVYNSFYLSPKLKHKDEIEPHLISQEISKDTLFHKKNNNRLSNLRKGIHDENGTDVSIKKALHGMNGCTHIQKTSKYGRHINISNLKKLNTSYSLQSVKSPGSSKRLNRLKMLNVINKNSFISRKTNPNIKDNGNFYSSDFTNNNNNSTMQMKSVIDSYIEDEYEDYSGFEDENSINKRSMNRLRLTNIFNPYNTHHIAPSELNAVSQISEIDRSNIFIRPANTFFKQFTNSQGSSLIQGSPSLNKAQFHYSKTNKCDKRNRNLGLSRAVDVKTCISCGFIKGSSTISKQLADLMENIKNSTNDNENSNANTNHSYHNSFITYPNVMSFIKGFSAFSYKNQKKNNEDKLCISIHCNIPNSDKTADFFGIYDGHCGSKVAEYLAEKVHVTILQHPKFLSDTITAIQESIALIESEIIRDNINLPIDSIEKSGACVLLMILVNDLIYFTNIGDSRAIIGTDSGLKLASLTIDHKPNEINEEKRILQCGGKIEGFLKNEPGRKLQKMVYRTNPGFLSVSRSIGDVMTKLSHLSGRECLQSAKPDIFVLKNDKDFDFILLASDGIFDELTNNDIACEIYHTARDIIESNKTFEEFLRCSIINLMKYAIEEGAKGNLSIIFIVFDNLRKNIEKHNLEKINLAITRLENTLMDGDKLYPGIESKHLYIFDKSELNKLPSTIAGTKITKGNETSFLTSAHNKSMISLRKIDCFANSKQGSKLKLSFMSRLKEKMCCGFFS